MAGKVGSDHSVGASERPNQLPPRLPGPSQPVNEEQNPGAVPAVV
jgi:hypothetical protein